MTAPPPVELGLTAAIVAVTGDRPLILTTRGPAGEPTRPGEAALPSGPFDALKHRTLEIGLRGWVAEQTGAPLGYVEQLYTFGDRGRLAQAGDREPHVVSVGYLALTRASAERGGRADPLAGFRGWYDFFPWEDFRAGRPALLDQAMLPSLTAWAEATKGVGRRERLRFLFGVEGAPFDEERTLERYELLYEAGLVEEARRDRRSGARPAASLGEAMRFDHRRILATAMGRLRAKLKYRPVIFELMPAAFTLTALQRTVEAISGRHLHKQNFRRLVESTELVEPTGDTTHATGGRPAALYRFRREVVAERPAPGLRV
ncbi:MAG: NAD regulator [Methylobacteriaceae bacterium]|nr:NAD regulator [Methylobacteriaceae bacterium]